MENGKISPRRFLASPIAGAITPQIVHDIFSRQEFIKGKNGKMKWVA
jgi:hypothetical protein